MKKVSVFDTYVSSANMGDAIIMDYSVKQLRSVFSEDFFYHIPTHEYNRRKPYTYIRRCDEKIVCGSNLLRGRMMTRNQWKLNLIDATFLKNVCLLGVGTGGNFEKLDRYSKYIYKSILSSSRIHSVRDEHSEKIMRSMGFDNVLNTGCPSTWALSPEHCEQIGKTKQKNVVTTLTDYDQNEVLDKAMIQILSEEYDNVFLWIQGFDDYDYAKRIGVLNQVKCVSPALKAYDEVLQQEDVEYVGTRLHAGIRALNHQKRASILAVDARATGMAACVKLHVMKRADVQSQLKDYIHREQATELQLPTENILKWKSQFI